MIAVRTGWVKVDATFPGDPGADPLATALDDARGLIQENCRALTQVYQRLRSTHQVYLTRLHHVEEQLFTVAQQVDEAMLRRSGRLARGVSLATLERHRQLHSLRQEHEWLTERLMALAGSARKIQAIARQIELTGSYLEGDVVDAAGVDEPGELAQLQSLQAQEEERRRLARDVHDGPAQVLANAIFEIGYCKRFLHQDVERAEAGLDQLEGDLRASLAEVRQFIHDLQPGSIAEFGLVPSLTSYLDDFYTRTGLTTCLDVEPDFERLPPPVELGIFRIVQEALQNVRKHSKARHVQVAISRGDESLEVSVKDDGVGFATGGLPAEPGHYGITSMRDRARLLGAELSVSSAPGRGTKVSLNVPTNWFASDLS